MPVDFPPASLKPLVAEVASLLTERKETVSVAETVRSNSHIATATKLTTYRINPGSWWPPLRRPSLGAGSKCLLRRRFDGPSLPSDIPHGSRKLPRIDSHHHSYTLSRLASPLQIGRPIQSRNIGVPHPRLSKVSRKTCARNWTLRTRSVRVEPQVPGSDLVLRESGTNSRKFFVGEPVTGACACADGRHRDTVATSPWLWPGAVGRL